MRHDHKNHLRDLNPATQEIVGIKIPDQDVEEWKATLEKGLKEEGLDQRFIQQFVDVFLSRLNEKYYQNRNRQSYREFQALARKCIREVFDLETLKNFKEPVMNKPLRQDELDRLVNILFGKE